MNGGPGGEGGPGDGMDSLLQAQLVVEPKAWELGIPAGPGKVVHRLSEVEDLDALQFTIWKHGDHESFGQGADPVAVEVGEAHDGVVTFGDPAMDGSVQNGDSGELLGPEMLGLGGPKGFLPEGGPWEGSGEGIVPGNQDLSRPPERGEKSADDEEANQGLEDVTDGDAEDFLLASVRG